MDVGFLLDYINVVTLGICLLLGYAIKQLDWIPNKYIPLCALVVGCVINILTHIGVGIDGTVILGGMISGVASTGMYEMVSHLVDKKE